MKYRAKASKQIIDLCLLVGIAIVICLIGVAAFVVAEIRHVNPVWVFLSLVSIGFLLGAREEYRKEFRSARFVLFVLTWLMINMAVIVVVLGTFGWLLLIPVLFLEQVLFYVTASWIFNVQPGSRA